MVHGEYGAVLFHQCFPYLVQVFSFVYLPIPSTEMVLVMGCHPGVSSSNKQENSCIILSLTEDNYIINRR